MGRRRRARVPVRLGRDRRRRAPLRGDLGARPGRTRRQRSRRFVDLVLDRLERDPSMHVYHYGGYESGALKRLMQRHATREDEVDRLLRGRRLVNLYDHVLRQGDPGIGRVVLDQEDREVLPARARGRDHRRGLLGRGVRALDGDGRPGHPRRDRRLQPRRLRLGVGAPRLARGAPGRGRAALPGRRRATTGAGRRRTAADLAASQAETRAREDALREGVPADRAERDEEQQGRWLLAGLLDWHRREAKPQWWDHFRLMEAPVDDLIADGSALGGLEFVEDLGPMKQSRVYRYRFDPSQETKLHVGKSPIDPATGEGAGEIVGFDPLQGTIDLKRVRAPPHPRGLIPSKPYGPEPMRGALGAPGRLRHRARADRPGPYRAARDLVLRRPPRIDAPARGRAARPARRDAARRRPPARRRARRTACCRSRARPARARPTPAPAWRSRSSSGGKRVGVAAQSHRVIAQLPRGRRRGRPRGGSLRPDRPARDEAEDASPHEDVERVSRTRRSRRGLASGEFQVVGGTSWLWARDDMADAVDVLFVDEAGQLSLATVVLGGRFRALARPARRPEPAAAGLAGHPPGRRRGLGARAPARRRRTIAAGPRPVPRDDVPPPPRGERLRLRRVLRGPPRDRCRERHPGPRPAACRSAAKASGSSAVAARRRPEPLARGGGVGRRGDRGARGPAVDGPEGQAAGPRRAGRPRRRPLQRPGRRDRRASPRSGSGVLPNVGTVDKFQGREAPVAIYSMTTSSPEDAPRDLEFLYSGNRLNVAISRARGLAVLVASARTASRRLPDAGADAAGQRLLPVHRDRRRAGTGRRSGRGRRADLGVRSG